MNEISVSDVFFGVFTHVGVAQRYLVQMCLFVTFEKPEIKWNQHENPEIKLR